MLRVVLVDDEQWSIDYMRSLIDWRQNGAVVDACFTDPDKALRYISQNDDIDIVFLDIEMPELSGTEFIESALSLGCKSKFVIVSGHDSFSYAQKAMRLGVTDYLLKPVDRDDVKKILAETAGREQDGRHLKDIGERIVDIWRLAQDERVYCIVSDISAPIDTEKLKSRVGESDIKRYDSIRNSAWFYKSRRGFCEEWIDEGCEVGVCSTDNANSTVKSLMLNACDAYEGCFFTDGNVCTYNVDFEENIGRILPVVKNYIQSKQVERLHGQIDKFFEEINHKKMQANVAVVFFNRVIMSLTEDFSQKNGDNYYIIDGYHAKKKFSTREEMIEFLHGVVNETFEVQDDYLMMVKSKDLVPKIKDFIDKNCQNELNLSIISGEFAMSPKYLSSMFKRVTGINLNSYINMTRIARAKVMLEQTNVAIQDVSYLCGFADCSYFTKVFKRYTGLSPTEYKNLKK